MGHRRVIVLGSGMSGLACAKELIQRGYEVLVVEARSRAGGRLKGEPLRLHPSSAGTGDSSASHAVDLGGALVHGIEGNPIHRLTTQMGVPLHEISDYCLLLNENGWPFDPKEDDKISNMFNECLDITFQRAGLDKGSRRTFGDLFEEVCREKGVSPSNPLLKWHQANLELPTGADFGELGYTWNDDEPYGFAGAHAAIETSWKFVMDTLSNGVDVLYNSPVTRIQVVLPDGSTPESYPEASPPALRTESTETKKKTDGALPGEKDQLPIKTITRTEWRKSTKPQAASAARRSRRIRGEDVSVRRSSRSNKGEIQKLMIGHDWGSVCYNDPSKKRAPRKRKRPTAENGSQENDLPNSSTVQVTLQNGSVLEADALVCTLPLGILKVPIDAPGHVHFSPPLPVFKQKAIDELGCGLLNKCAISFPTVFWQDSEFLGLAKHEHSYLVLNATKYTGKPILIFMYGGSFAKEIESWTDTAILEDCLSVLKKICGREVPPPVDYCVSRWGKEQFSRMAFTYIPPGVDGPKRLAAAGEALHDPFLPEKPLIMFAGEHTTPYHPSTMHGAFLSGIREAYRYDLFVEPELNGNMEFDTDHKIYERTFPMRKSFRGKRKNGTKKVKKETKNIVAPSSSCIRSRRHRFAGMALRKQPKKTNTDSAATTTTGTPSKKKTSIASPEKLGSRRSQRSLSSMKAPEIPSSSVETVDPKLELERKKSINDLEDRTLLRSLESYGRDYGLIRSKIVPVFGSTRKRSKEQIKQRWQQLARHRRRIHVWKQWEAKTVAPVPLIEPSVLLEKYNKERMPIEKVGKRRSKRGAKHRLLIDL